MAGEAVVRANCAASRFEVEPLTKQLENLIVWGEICDL